MTEETRKCSECKYFYPDAYGDEEVIFCLKEHWNLVGYKSEACKDFDDWDWSEE